MKTIWRTGPILLLGMMMTAIVPAPAGGHESPIAAMNAWVRATPPGATVTAAYLMLRNRGGHADRLVKVSTKSVRAVEIHKVVEKGGTSHMQPVQGGVSISAGGTVRFEPGGYHIMLIGLEKPVKPGDRLELLLTFEKHPPLRIVAVAKKSGEGMGSHKMGAGKKGGTHKMKMN